VLLEVGEGNLPKQSVVVVSQDSLVDKASTRRRQGVDKASTRRRQGVDKASTRLGSVSASARCPTRG
jgi:hypothetical protein